MGHRGLRLQVHCPLNSLPPPLVLGACAPPEVEHGADISRSLGSRAAPYDIMFLFVRLPLMDTQTLIMDRYHPPLFDHLSSLYTPFHIPPRFFIL